MDNLRGSRVDTLATRLIDFHQRRITNAAPSVDDYDYVVRKELKKGIEDTRRTITTSNLSGGLGYRDIVFGVNGDLVVGDDINPHYISLYEGTFEICGFKVKTAPVGAAILCQAVVNGTDNLFSTSITVPDGITAAQTKVDFNVTLIHFLDVVTFNVTQIGSTTPGATLTVFIRYKITEAPLS